MYGANEAAVLEDRELPRYIRITDVRTDGTLHDDTFRSLEEEVAAPYLLIDGDILLARSGATVGKSFQYLESWGTAAYAGYLIRCRPDQSIIFPRFANYYFQTSCYWACVYSSLIQSTIENFSAEKYKELKLPLPPLPEQRHIAAFLDWKTGQIDALIAKKQALIEKLKEKRLAVITQAVTKGLDPSVPLRDSGISWLGKVPKHWQQKRLKWVIMFQRGHDLPAEERNHGEVPLVSSSGISALHDVAIAKGPGIVTGRYGTIGVFHLVEEDYWPLNTTLYSIDLYGNNPRFLCSLLANLSPLFLLNAKKSAVPGVDRSDLHAIPVVLPEIEEQNEIADYLEIEEQKYLAMKARVEEAISRLTEYRTALITAVTTGQIDVRKVAIPAQA